MSLNVLFNINYYDMNGLITLNSEWYQKSLWTFFFFPPVFSLIEVVQELALAAQQEEIGLLSEAGTFTQFLKTSAFVSNTFMKFINKQLAYFNCKYCF